MDTPSFIPALRYKWLTPFYDRILNLTFPEKRIKEDLIRELGLNGNETILDFGCGTGTLSLMVKKQFPLVAITGLDVDDDVLSIAEAKAEQGHLDIYLTKYDGEHIPFRDHQQFDMIISSLAFHHIPTATKGPLLKQLYDITKPGGKIVIADFGKPRTIYTKIAFGFFRRLDGKENTQTNRDGLLPEFVKVSRFSEVHITSSFNTAFGTIDIIKGRKVV